MESNHFSVVGLESSDTEIFIECKQCKNVKGYKIKEEGFKVIRCKSCNIREYLKIYRNDTNKLSFRLISRSEYRNKGTEEKK